MEKIESDESVFGQGNKPCLLACWSPASNQEFMTTTKVQSSNNASLDALPCLALEGAVTQPGNQPGSTDQAARPNERISNLEPTTLINRLDSDNPRSRISAQSELTRRGVAALPDLLRATSENNLSREGAIRLQTIIAELLQNSGAAMLQLHNATSSPDQAVAAGARSLVRGISTDALLDYVSKNNSDSAISRQDLIHMMQIRNGKEWRETLSAYIGQSPNTNRDRLRGIVAAEALGNHSEAFNLSLALGRSQISAGDTTAGNQSLSRGLNALARMLNAPGNPPGLDYAIDFQQQINNCIETNPNLTPEAVQSLRQQTESARMLEMKFHYEAYKKSAGPAAAKK